MGSDCKPARKPRGEIEEEDEDDEEDDEKSCGIFPSEAACVAGRIPRRAVNMECEKGSVEGGIINYLPLPPPSPPQSFQISTISTKLIKLVLSSTFIQTHSCL